MKFHVWTWRKYLLSTVICLPIYFIAREISDTFFCGAFAAIVYVALDRYFVEGERT